MTARDLRVFVVAAVACAAIQLASAAVDDRSLETPNTSTEIAHSLVQTGVYGAAQWAVLRGPLAHPPETPLRAYQLPGEPLYLALGFRALPEAAWRFLSVPVVVSLVLAVGVLAWSVGGRLVAILAMAVLALDPFVIRHGPVWDDALLGAALQWAVFGVMACHVRPLEPVSAPLGGEASRRWRRIGLTVAVIALAGLAALTRLSCGIALCIASAAVLMSRPLRPRLKWDAVAALAGVATGVAVWTARNWIVFGVLFAGTSHDGITIYRSTAASARASLLTTGTTESLDPQVVTPVFRAVRDLDEVEIDRFYRRAAVAHMLDAPLDVARTAALKIAVSVIGLDLWRPLGAVRNAGAAMANGVLLITGLIGCARLRRRPAGSDPRGRGLFAVTVVAALVPMCLLLAVGPVGLRYRIDLTVILAIGTAVLLSALRPAWRLHAQRV